MYVLTYFNKNYCHSCVLTNWYHIFCSYFQIFI